jgi:tRNA-binding protein
MADFNKFLEIDIRAGTIIDVQQFPEARKPAFKLEIDFGHLGTKKSSAQITELYDTEALLGKQILAVVNFPPRQIGPFISEVLTLGVPNGDGHVVLVAPEMKVKNGVRLY